MIQLAVIGTSKIAHEFATALSQVPEVALAGVFSRDAARASAAAKEMGARKPWWDLASMLASPEIDAVYIASPNAVHYSQCQAALESGKHVLVEKPAVVTSDEFRSLVDLASSKGLVIFEGMRSAYDPGMAQRSAPSVGFPSSTLSAPLAMT